MTCKRFATVVIAGLIYLACVFGMHAATARSSVLVPAKLRVESLDCPVGVDSGQPRFSWTFESKDPNARALSQTAYQVIVASSPELLSKDQGDLWDSSRVSSTSYIQIEYAGKALLSHTTYFWKVRTWDQGGSESNWSKSANWTTALLKKSDWEAKWIAAEVDGPSQTPAIEHVDTIHNPAKPLPLFRKDFELKGSIRSAVVYVSGLGQYELHLNGSNVTDTVLNPGWTNYRKTILYNTFDVSMHLHKGRNTLGVLLGNGMYNVPNNKERYTKFTGFFGQPKLILQLHVTYADGTSTTVLSDSSWKSTSGPIIFSSTYGGEDYYARKNPQGWDSPGFDDSKMDSGIRSKWSRWRTLRPHHSTNRTAETFQPVKTSEPRPGILVYDLGQNLAGWPGITVRGHEGDTVRLTAGEL